ncbi:MAG: metal ABC transporter ATP-binding protein [Campylobacterales bacterium]|nr:metal ABC transporter ATP-binding protein [Campylobacterales bacterium]
MNFAPAVFEAKGLSYAIDGTYILKEIDLVIKKGEYSALIGPNGGGKTTLVRLLLGLEKKSAGEIRLFGKDQKAFRSWDKIGYVPQRVSQVDQYFPATVEEVVKMGRTAKRGLFQKESPSDREAVASAMTKMDVTSLRHKLIGELSGGQRQRVMIARALASEPEVLILDEPNTGVDMVSQNSFYALLRELNQKDGMTILFITHDVGVIADDIQSMLCINQTLLSCNNPHEVLSCSEMSKLYGIDAHLIHHHHH